jgi:hypothetical protein
MTKRDEAYAIISKLYPHPAIHWFQHKYEVMHQWPMTLEEMSGWDEDVALAYAKGQHVLLTQVPPPVSRYFICWNERFYKA